VDNWKTGSEPQSHRTHDKEIRLSPTTFIWYLERVMDTIKENGTKISVHGHKINNLKFADDIDLLEEDWDELQENLRREASGLKINIQKTMTMVLGQENIIEKLMMNSTRIENVTECVYLGSW